MKVTFALGMLFLLVELGCNYQGGQYSSSGDKSRTLSATAGCVVMVQGNAVGAFGCTGSSNQNLLYLVIVCQGIPANAASNSSTEYGTYATTVSYTWRYDTNRASVQVRWDRQTDTISVGGVVLQRAKGNLVLIRRQPNGVFEIRQLSSLGPKDEFGEVIQALRRQVPNDPTIASLELTTDDK